MRLALLSLVSLLTLVTTLVGSASAVPVAFDATYLEGTECPSDASGPFTGNERQYSVSTAERCMYIDITTGDYGNPTGTQTEANDYLNSPEANAAGWGTAALTDNWVGLLGAPNAGFWYDVDTTNEDGDPTSGSFLFQSPLTDTYNQFAIAVKDGGVPKWAIFMLPVNEFGGDWTFLSGGGSLSHFAFYGRNVQDFTCPDGSPSPCPLVTEAPEPASLILLGAGLLGGAARFRKRNKQVA